MSRKGSFLACALLMAFASAADTVPNRWEELKREWAIDHLNFAKELLKHGCAGFADTQAGLAGQLVGPEDPGGLA